jgi:hypothetical protein
MPYDRKLGKMVWTTEDKIRAVVYLSVMFGILILFSYFAGVKTQEAIDSGAITESDLQSMENMIESRVMFMAVLVVAMLIISIIINVFYQERKNP